MKKAIIIGATSGIGYHLAVLLARSGYKVVGSGRRRELLDKLKAENPEKIAGFELDVTHAQALPTGLQAMTDTLGGVDLMVYCSGNGNANASLDYQIERETNEVNVDAFTRVAAFAYNIFKDQHSGHFVNISSIMGLRGSCAAPAYAASKAYQINYLEGLHQRAKAEKLNISITDIRPGSVDTDMMKGAGHFWITQPQSAAQLILSAISKRKSVKYISRRWSIIGALLKILPRFIYVRIGRM